MRNFLLLTFLLISNTIFSQTNRPQTPHPPYPYHSDSVEYDNPAKTVHLGATLTYPDQGGPFPAAILITGSGIQDRDETLFGHKPFAVIADYLTKKGYAVLRVDDRSAGRSTGDLKTATSADFAKDVETSFDWLRNHRHINPKKIGLIGHSEGGMIAPILASENKDIAFIISLAGPLNGDSTTMFQVRTSLQLFHASDAYIDYAAAQERMVLKNAKLARDSVTIMQDIDHDYRAYYASIPDSSKTKETFYAKPDNFIHSLAPQARTLVSPWWHFFIAYDATPYYAKVKCPVLLLGGDKDFHVHNAVDLPAIANILKQHHNDRVETRLMPGLNHLFQHCHTCTLAEYGQLEETFSPEVLAIMGDWLDKNVR